MLSKKLLKALTSEPTPEQQAAAEASRRKAAEEWQKKVEEDARLAVPRAIEKLRKEAAAALAQADQIESLLKEYPDLRQFTGRWNKVAYYSKSVNTKVDRFDLRHNCGCCNDSPLELWPYLETPGGNVYSDPPKFIIGEKHWIAGDRSEVGWKESLKTAGLPETIIGAVSMHFRKCADERRVMAEDDNEYDEDSDGGTT
jgi:hypothetical protein